MIRGAFAEAAFGTKVARDAINKPMVNIWIIAGSALAAAAAALVLRRRRNDRTSQTPSAVGPVSEEWLSTARGQADQGW